MRGMCERVREKVSRYTACINETVKEQNQSRQRNPHPQPNKPRYVGVGPVTVLLMFPMSSQGRLQTQF